MNTQEFLEYFEKNGISHEYGNGLNMVLKYQDLIGRLSLNRIQEIFDTFNQSERKLFCWVNLRTLSYEMAMDILKNTTLLRFKEDYIKNIEEANEERERYIQERFQAVCEREKAFIDREGMEQKIKKLEAEKETLINQISNLISKADKFDKLKAILA